MADSGKRKSEARRHPKRLQKKAPPTLQINPVVKCNAAIPLLSPTSVVKCNAVIPLLSPLVSPTSDDAKIEIRSCSSNGNEPLMTAEVEAEKLALILHKWQNPASPFYYDPTRLMPFVHSGSSDR